MRVRRAFPASADSVHAALLAARGWTTPIQWIVALGAVSLVLTMRWFLGPEPEGLYFMPLFVVLLPLAFLVRPAAFLAAAVFGLGATWYVFLPPVFSLQVQAQENISGAMLFAAAVLMAALLGRMWDRVHQARFGDQQELRENENDARLLQQLSAELTRQDDVDSLYQRIVHGAAAILRSQFASMQMFYPDRGPRGELKLLGQIGFTEHAARTWEWVSGETGQSCCAHALRSGTRVIVTDTETSELIAGTEDRATFLAAGIRSVQSTPLRSRDGRLIGMISTHWDHPHQPSERDLRNLDILARLAADVIECKLVERRLRESEEQFRRAIQEAPIPTILHTEDGEILQLGRAWTAITGKTIDDASNVRHWLTRTYGSQETDRQKTDRPRTGIAAVVDRIVSSPGQVLGPIECEALTRNGETRHWLYSASGPLRLRDGRRFVVGMAQDITDRKQAELRLERKRRMFHDVVDGSPYGLYIVDSQFRIAHINGASQAGAFRNVQPALGRDFAEAIRILWPEPLATWIIGIFRHTLETGEPYRSPGLTEPRNDIEATESYEWELKRITLADGQYGVVCYYFDATALKQMQFQLKQREDFLAGVLGSITDALYVLDRDSRFVFVNDEIVRRFGKPREEILGLRLWDMFLEAACGEACTQQMLAMTERIRVEYEVYYAPWDRWFRDKAYPTGDGGLAVYSQDITDRKRAEAMLRAKERELATIVNLSPFMMTRCSRDLRYQFVSQAYAQMLGRQPEELSGKRIVDIMGEEGFEAIFPHVQHVLDGQIVRYESEVRFNDIGARMLSAVYTPERDSAGRVIGWVASILDVTERRLAELERDRLLECERAARAEAETAARMKDEFLSVLSHELRTPLSAIIGWMSMIEKRPGDPKVLADGLPVIARNARAQARLICDLLDMSRILAGKIQIERCQVSVADIIQHAIQSLQLAVDEKQIRLETVFEPIEGVVRGDPARLQQIVGNLLSNAVKFTGERGHIRVQLRRQGDIAEISVADNGAGIAPEFLPHVFDKFRQADGSTNRRHDGLGLGLTIVKHLVQLHGGAVLAHSPGLDQGSTFTVQLPLAAETADAAGNGRPEDQQRVSDEIDLTGVKVVAVDDHRDTAALVQRLLEDCRAQVCLAGSAEEAVRLILDQQPDVILCDLGMPERDGYQFIRDLRASGDDTPAIALTAFVRPEDRERAVQAGFNAHLSKPLNPPDLLATVARFARAASLR